MANATTTRSERGAFFTDRRHRSAVALLLGALAMELLVQQQVVRFYYTPLIVGLTYLGAAAVAGRKGALWAPGIVTSCWGIAVLLGVHQVVTIDGKLSYEIAGFIGVALALALRYTVGLAAGVVGLVVSMAVIFAHSYAHAPAWIFNGITFAVLLGAWGLWELRPSRRPAQAQSSSAPAERDRSFEGQYDAPNTKVRAR